MVFLKSGKRIRPTEDSDSTDASGAKAASTACDACGGAKRGTQGCNKCSDRLETNVQDDDGNSQKDESNSNLPQKDNNPKNDPTTPSNQTVSSQQIENSQNETANPSDKSANPSNKTAKPSDKTAKPSDKSANPSSSQPAIASVSGCSSVYLSTENGSSYHSGINLTEIETENRKDLKTEKEGDDDEDEDEEEEEETETGNWKREPRPRSALGQDHSREPSPAQTVVYDLVDSDSNGEKWTDDEVEEVVFVKVTHKAELVDKTIVIEDNATEDAAEDTAEDAEVLAGDAYTVEDPELMDVAIDMNQTLSVKATTAGIQTIICKYPLIATAEAAGGDDDSEEVMVCEPPSKDAKRSLRVKSKDRLADDPADRPTDDSADQPTDRPSRRPAITACIEEIVPEKYRTIYFQGLKKSTCDEDIWTYFAQWGEIEKLTIRNGEGHLIFKKFHSVDSCMKSRPLSLDGATFGVRRVPQKPEDNHHEDTIYVSGIFHLRVEALEKYFTTFGCVKECSVKPVRGFAFVTFTDSDSVEKCILQRFHHIETLLVECQRAFKKNPNQQQMRAPRHPLAPRPFDSGPRSRPQTATNILVTPFPRLVEIKPKVEAPGSDAGMKRCESATSGRLTPAIKSEPAWVKTEVEG